MLNSEEKEIIVTALNMRLNYVQTGSVSLSPHDVQAVGADYAKQDYGAEIKPLTVEQMELIVATDRLIKKILSM
jgi:hypothetical protein